MLFRSPKAHLGRSGEALLLTNEGEPLDRNTVRGAEMNRLS